MADFGVKVDAPFEETVGLVTNALERHGFTAARSFDLRQALQVQDPPCSCPYHGTAACDCNYAVLLVYGAARAEQPTAPHQIVIHGHEGESWLGVPAFGELQGASQDADTDRRLLRALAEALAKAMA